MQNSTCLKRLCGRKEMHSSTSVLTIRFSNQDSFSPTKTLYVAFLLQINSLTDSMMRSAACMSICSLQSFLGRLCMCVLNPPVSKSGLYKQIMFPCMGCWLKLLTKQHTYWRRGKRASWKPNLMRKAPAVGLKGLESLLDVSAIISHIAAGLSDWRFMGSWSLIMKKEWFFDSLSSILTYCTSKAS